MDIKTTISIVKKYPLEIVTCFFLVIMVLMVGINVTLRYLFNTGIDWTFEFSRYLYVWIVFLGSAMAIKHNEHIAVEMLLDRLPRKARVFFRLVGDILVILFILVLTIAGIIFVIKTAGVFFSRDMRIPMYWIYLIFPLSGILMFIEMLKVIRKHWKD